MRSVAGNSLCCDTHPSISILASSLAQTDTSLMCVERYLCVALYCAVHVASARHAQNEYYLCRADVDSCLVRLRRLEATVVDQL